MFGKHTHLERRLRQSGRKAQADVVSVRPGRAIEHGDAVIPGNVELEWKLELRVRPEGEEVFSAEVTARSRQLPHVATGQVVTVLYDPDDHRSVVVDSQAAEQDRDALIQWATERAAQQRQRTVPPAASPIPGAAGSSDPVELLTKLAQLHESGALTDEEFATEKKRILGGRT